VDKWESGSPDAAYEPGKHEKLREIIISSNHLLVAKERNDLRGNERVTAKGGEPIIL
jgi:hypothetical protein